MEFSMGARRGAWRGTPEHVAVIRALTALDYEFENRPCEGTALRSLGYTPDSVVEVIGGSTATVSLLVSASPQRRAVVSSTMAIVAVASATGVDFLDWLTKQMRQRGRDVPWVASRQFKRRRVRAELLTDDAMLLTVEGMH